MEKCLIVAVDDRNAIGVAGNLPWHISEDLKYFKRITLGCPVIMGRKTYESLPFKPLKDRVNIVLSRSAFEIPGVVCVKSMQEAYSAAGDAPRCFVIGGATVYSEALEDMDRLYITKVHTQIQGADAFFPALEEGDWVLEEKSETMKDPQNGLEFEFTVYTRK